MCIARKYFMMREVRGKRKNEKSKHVFWKKTEKMETRCDVCLHYKLPIYPSESHKRNLLHTLAHNIEHLMCVQIGKSIFL